MSRRRTRRGVVGRGLVGRGPDCRAEPLERRTLFATVSFNNPQDFPVGTGPTGVAVADLGNGHPDIIVANQQDNTVSVLLGNGRGSFAAQVTYPVGVGPADLAVGDVNGDGRPDVVTANLTAGTVSVLLGNGNGTFAAPQSFAAGSHPVSVALADLNGDGRPDVVVANQADNTVGVLLGNGDGTFGAQQAYAVGQNPLAVATANLGNGTTDVVVVNATDGTVGVLVGTGTGTLGAMTAYPVGANPARLAVADVTGDGKPDVVVANTGTTAGSISVFRGNGDGNLSAQATIAVPYPPYDLAVADFGNGHPDIVYSENSGNAVEYLQGDGTGNFAAPQSFAIDGVGSRIVAADVNGDGLPDLVTANPFAYLAGATNSVSVVANVTNGGGGTTPTPTPTATKALRFVGSSLSTAAAAQTLPPVSVEVDDLTTGNRLTIDASAVTLTVVSGPAGGALAGVTTVNASGGLATFAGLSVSVAGNYVLAATADAATPTASVTLAAASAATATAVTPVGSLNPNFGTNGIARHNVGFTTTTGVAADGTSSVLIGPIGAAPDQSFGVTRYTATGDLDTSFGTAGVTRTPFAGSGAVPTAVSVLSNGDILVAGTAYTYDATGTAAVSSRFAVAEYDSSGNLVSSFGTGGTQTVAFGSAASNDVLRGLAVAPNGRIYLAGRSDAAGHGNSDFAVAALTAGGALDTGFTSTGTALVDIAGGDDAIAAVAVQPNGYLLAAGSAVAGSTTEAALVRFTPAKGLDPTFGGPFKKGQTKGIVTSSVNGVYDAASTLAVSPAGAIYVGGVTATGSGSGLASSFLVQQYNTRGKLVPAWGTKGSAVTSFGQPAAVSQVVLLSDGSVIASGRTGSSFATATDVAVVRYTAKGQPNAGFGTGGKVVIDLGSGAVASPAMAAAAAVDLGAAFDAFTGSTQGAVAVTPGGQILVAGQSGADTAEAELIAAGVDLVASVLASSVPAAAVAGLKGTATITVTDAGTDKALGPITVAVQFSTDALGTGAVTAKTVAGPSGLLPGKGKTIKVAFVYPTGLSAGGYYLVTTVAGGTALGPEVKPADNFAASPSTVAITPAVVALTGSALSAAGKVTAGRPVHVSVTLANGGNVTAAGKVAVNLYLSTDGTLANGIALTVPAVAVSVPAGKSKRYAVTATLPPAVAAGTTYTLLAVVDPGRSLGGIDQTDVAAVVVDPTPVAVS